ncbi:hypothetical protein [Haloarcula sp. CGMCC 1.2071]|uniref:hypothetical protein n=1 Tax=Haloarcula sp. CGMCC 1.2071 TaxID=3111454 RepID=UPI00300E9E7E
MTTEPVEDRAALLLDLLLLGIAWLVLAWSVEGFISILLGLDIGTATGAPSGSGDGLHLPVFILFAYLGAVATGPRWVGYPLLGFMWLCQRAAEVLMLPIYPFQHFIITVHEWLHAVALRAFGEEPVIQYDRVEIAGFTLPFREGGSVCSTPYERIDALLPWQARVVGLAPLAQWAAVLGPLLLVSNSISLGSAGMLPLVLLFPLGPSSTDWREVLDPRHPFRDGWEAVSHVDAEGMR